MRWCARMRRFGAPSIPDSGLLPLISRYCSLHLAGPGAGQKLSDVSMSPETTSGPILRDHLVSKQPQAVYDVNQQTQHGLLSGLVAYTHGNAEDATT